MEPFKRSVIKYKIDDEKVVFDDFYSVMQAQVTYDTFTGNKISTKRLAFERGDSVAIVLYEKETKSILLTKQFRYPSCKHNEGWLVEIPAGSLDDNESPEDCICREVMEELGYKIKSPTPIGTFYTSPGACTERIFLFFSEVSLLDKLEEGGGNSSENEDIQLVKIPVLELKQKIYGLKDAKTILGLQWFLLEKSGKNS